MQAQVSGGASLRTPMAWSDYVAIGEAKYTEYYDGLCVVNPPNRRHALAQIALQHALEEVCPAGFVVYPSWGWHIEDGTEFVPDLMVAPLDAPGDDQLRVPPLLVAEIGSPSTRDVDRGRKRELYGAAGLPWYWLVDLDSPLVAVMRNEAGTLVEAQRIGAGGAVTVGPVEVFVDPASLTTP
jgi:Uma2 family endonuclease